MVNSHGSPLNKRIFYGLWLIVHRLKLKYINVRNSTTAPGNESLH